MVLNLLLAPMHYSFSTPLPVLVVSSKTTFGKNYSRLNLTLSIHVRDPAHREQKVGRRRDNFTTHPCRYHMQWDIPAILTWSSYRQVLLKLLLFLPTMSGVSKFLPLITLRNTWRDPVHACLNISLDGKLFTRKKSVSKRMGIVRTRRCISGGWVMPIPDFWPVKKR